MLASLKNADLKNSVYSVCPDRSPYRSYAVDRIELDVVLSDISLYLTWEVLIQLFMLPLAVQKECSAWLDILYHVVLSDIRLVMASNKVSLIDKVC